MENFLYNAEKRIRKNNLRSPLLIFGNHGLSARVAKTTAIKTYIRLKLDQVVSSKAKHNDKCSILYDGQWLPFPNYSFDKMKAGATGNKQSLINNAYLSLWVKEGWSLSKNKQWRFAFKEDINNE